MKSSVSHAHCVKGRGTRKHNFAEEMFDPARKSELGSVEKSVFRLFDFFANCEYFKGKFQYDEELKLPNPASMPLTTGDDGPDGPGAASGLPTSACCRFRGQQARAA